MVDDEQRDALHLGRRGEAQHRLALAVRAEALDRPALVADLALGVEHLQQPFVALRFRIGPLLGFVDNLRALSARRHCREQRELQGSRLRSNEGPHDPFHPTFALRLRAFCDLFIFQRLHQRAVQRDSAGQIGRNERRARIVGTSARRRPIGTRNRAACRRCRVHDLQM
jgi:hypothetical protein